MRTALLPVCFALAACTSDETVGRYGAAGSVWTLSDINGVPFSATATMRFPTPGTIAGRGPCNAYSGIMTAPYPWFEAEQLETGTEPCPQAEAEGQYFHALQSVSQSEVLADTLILSGDGIEMLFRAGG